MFEDEQKKSGGGKLSRSEIVTIRLDPQLRYLVEIAARKQRRTLSSYVEWMLEESLSKTIMQEVGNEIISLADEKICLWDVDEADRFVKLALKYIGILNHYEQILWKLIKENGYFWKGKKHRYTDKWVWDLDIQSIIFERLRAYWKELNKVAKGEADKSILPKIDEESVLDNSHFDDLTDDVPF